MWENILVCICCAMCITRLPMNMMRPGCDESVEWNDGGVQENDRAPWISMEDTVFSDEDSEVTTVTAAAARYKLISVFAWVILSAETFQKLSVCYIQLYGKVGLENQLILLQVYLWFGICYMFLSMVVFRHIFCTSGQKSQDKVTQLSSTSCVYNSYGRPSNASVCLHVGAHLFS